MAGKYHIWIHKDIENEHIESIVCTRSANPSVGDQVDTSAYCNQDINGERAYYSFENWEDYTINGVRDESKVNYGYEPCVTVVVNPYDYTISNVYGPGVVPKKYVWSSGSIANYYVSKNFWPNGIRFRVVFDCEYDPALEGPYVGPPADEYYTINSLTWDYNSETNTATIANDPEDAHCVELVNAGDWQSYNSNLVNYWFFKTSYTGPQ